VSKTMYGLAGKLLRVNLSTGTCVAEPTPVEIYTAYLGGRGVGAYLLTKEVTAGADPLGPDNKLIFTTGPLTGTLTPGAGRMNVAFRSPLTCAYSYSLCGGHLAAEFKFAGYDVVIIEGQASKPVYLWINDAKVELRDAAHLWGLDTHATEDAIRVECRDTRIHTACIGPTGEKLVRYAMIQSDYHREFGRGGAGAVMGSKNLKAIVVRGTGQVSVSDRQHLGRLTEDAYLDLAASPKAKLRRSVGTPEMIDGTNKLGYWGTRNFSTGYFAEASAINAASLQKDYYEGSMSCYGCPIACGKVSKIKAGKYIDTKIEGPEFETVGLLGANCGIVDQAVIIKATELCDQYGMDTMSAGATVSLAMECFEQGIITTKDTGGMDLSFGSAEGLLLMLEQIVKRQGLGDILAEGSKRAAEHFGVPELAMQVKGQEFATYEPRGCVGMGLSYAVSTRGGHHMFAPTMGAETTGDGSRRLLTEGKAAMVVDTQAQMVVVDSLVLCASMRFAMSLDNQMEFYRAVTGRTLKPVEARYAAEKIIAIERLFNLREGFTRRDDTLPKRALQEPVPDGPSQGSKVDLEPMLEEYYSLMGYDTEGWPTADTLKRLELEEFASILQQKL